MHIHTAAAALLLVTPLALVWGASQDATTAEAPPARAVHFGPWEYRVVGIAELHGKGLEYLKKALDDAQGSESLMEGLLGVAKGADEQLAKKSEDLLNSLGAEGWELVQADARHMC
ncbi:MAG: hypothetical protein GY711_07235 [bacterium]|nr:hypothetical protein [bacterium]